MKLTLKRKKGFTLLEIIIVVIIVGVLASLALPRLFSTVEYSRTTEAFAEMGTIRSAMERCALRSGTGTYTGCTAAKMANLDIPDPDNEAGAHFIYTFVNPTVNGYTIKATRNSTVDNGAVTNYLELTVDTTGKTITRKGYTAYANVQ